MFLIAVAICFKVGVVLVPFLEVTLHNAKWKKELIKTFLTKACTLVPCSVKKCLR